MGSAAATAIRTIHACALSIRQAAAADIRCTRSGVVLCAATTIASRVGALPIGQATAGRTGVLALPDVCANLLGTLDTLGEVSRDDWTTNGHNRSTDVCQWVLGAKADRLAKRVAFRDHFCAAVFGELLDDFTNDRLAHRLAEADAAPQSAMSSSRATGSASGQALTII